jgi:hypothetical protein
MSLEIQLAVVELGKIAELGDLRMGCPKFDYSKKPGVGTQSAEVAFAGQIHLLAGSYH